MMAAPLMVVGGSQNTAIHDPAINPETNDPAVREPSFGAGGFGESGKVSGLSVLERVLRRLAGHTRRVGVDAAEERQLQDPAVLSRIAIRSRTTFPAFRDAKAVSTSADLPGRWLNKSNISSGGLGICWSDDAKQHGDNAIATPGSCPELQKPELQKSEQQIRQLWRPGRSYGASFLSDGDEIMLLGVCRSMFTAKGQQRFVYAGSLGPVRLPEVVQKQLYAVGQQVVNQVGAEGLFNADVLIDDDQKVCLLEVNGRWSASMECLERSLVDATKMQSENLSLIGLAMTSAEGKPLRVNQRRINSMQSDAPRYLKRIIYARRSGKIDESVFEEIELRKAIGFSQVEICDRPHHGQSVVAGEPLCSVICCLNARESLGWRKTKRLFASLQKAVV